MVLAIIFIFLVLGVTANPDFLNPTGLWGFLFILFMIFVGFPAKSIDKEIKKFDDQFPKWLEEWKKLVDKQEDIYQRMTQEDIIRKSDLERMMGFGYGKDIFLMQHPDFPAEYRKYVC